MAPFGDEQSPRAHATPDPTPAASENRRLSEILSDVFAEQERVAPLEMQLQQIGFFRKELHHMVNVVEQAPRAGWTVEARSALEGVLDTASDLRDALAARYTLPSFSVSASADMPLEETGLGEALEEEGLAAEGTGPEALQLAVEGLRDEIQVIRESLIDNASLADVLERSPDFMREMARGEFIEFCSVLKELVDSCLAALARVPADAGPAPPPPSTTASPVWPTPAPMPPVVPSASPPAASAPAATAPPASPAAAPAAETPTGADYQHRTDEEAVQQLQEFFDANSPEGTLLKAQEREFTRMVAEIVGVVCAGVTFTPQDLAMRIKVLRDTFAVRKRLHNKLTVREFKSFFGLTR
jgi:hypothetical protein